jgi:hypothetical protein
MNTPAWILETFAAMMVLVAEVSAGQVVIARAWTRRGGADAGIAVSQLLMGIAMTGILVSGLRILPNAVWEVVFAVMTAWFAWCLWRENRGRAAASVAHGHYAPHLVHSVAMLYLFAAIAGPSTAGPGGMSGMAWGSAGGMATLHAPMLALIFALLLVAFAVHDLDRRAGVDGYFQVAGSQQAGSGLAAAASGPAAYTAERLLLSPAVVKGCQVTIGVTMAFILIILI